MSFLSTGNAMIRMNCNSIPRCRDFPMGAFIFGVVQGAQARREDVRIIMRKAGVLGDMKLRNFTQCFFCHFWEENRGV